MYYLLLFFNNDYGFAKAWQRCVVLASRLLLVICVCVCVCGWVRMCANRSDRDAIVVSSLPACPATLWQKRVKKRVNKNRFSFLTTHSHITYRIFSLSLSPSAPWRLLWLFRVILSGLALALLMLLLAYTITVVCFFVVFVLSRSAKKKKKNRK